MSHEFNHFSEDTRRNGLTKEAKVSFSTTEEEEDTGGEWRCDREEETALGDDVVVDHRTETDTPRLLRRYSLNITDDLISAGLGVSVEGAPQMRNISIKQTNQTN